MFRDWHEGCFAGEAEGGTSKQDVRQSNAGRASGLAGSPGSGRGYEPRHTTTYQALRPASLVVPAPQRLIRQRRRISPDAVGESTAGRRKWPGQRRQGGPRRVRSVSGTGRAWRQLNHWGMWGPASSVLRWLVPPTPQRCGACRTPATPTHTAPPPDPFRRRFLVSAKVPVNSGFSRFPIHGAPVIPVWHAGCPYRWRGPHSLVIKEG